MPKVKLTITESRCRGGYLKEGQEFIVDDLCPPLCHELWNNIYPMVYALQNGAVISAVTLEPKYKKRLMAPLWIHLLYLSLIFTLSIFLLIHMKYILMYSGKLKNKEVSFNK